MYSIVKFNLKPVSDSINKVIVNNATLQLTLKNSQSTIGFGAADSVTVYLAGSATQLDTVDHPITATATVRIQRRSRQRVYF